jgi:sigma-B regulation protein RsbU (phosphoserine phosphatase)
MREDLKAHIEELKLTTAAQARVERDLAIAQEIQRDLVPRTFITDPPREEFALHALLDPAREIGGDFFDFLLRRGDELFFAVGDASGKGIPAALYMAQAKTLLASSARRGSSPAEALASVNTSLAERNEAAMFMTIFCGVLDLRSGRCRFANGGHPPPFILRREGAVEPVPKGEGPAVGSAGDASFAELELRLEPGDALVAFSDGVTEADCAGGGLFGEERIAAVLAGLRGQPPQVITASLRAAVSEFEAGTTQADDITILALLYRGRSST